MKITAVIARFLLGLIFLTFGLNGFLLVNRYVPLALTLLGPIIVNILLIHILMLPSGLPLALVVTVLWIVVFLSVRSAFAGLFQQRVPAQSLSSLAHGSLS